jgi:hypothetical protein
MEAKPICNLPTDAKAFRLRLRPDSVASAFIRFTNRIEHWWLAPKDGQTFNGPEWQLSVLKGVNQTK